jgi:membrane-bound ClpP family serine protease
MPGDRFPLRFVLSALVNSVLIADDRWLNVTGTVLITVVVIWWLVSPIVDARRMERHVEQNPELLRNEAIGKEVTALSAFALEDGLHTGVVLLHAEKWKAQCTAGPAPLRGDRLIVSGRCGLTLEVRVVAVTPATQASAES